MNRINRLFEEQKKDILSVYFTAGYPKLESTRNIILELQKQGVHQIEIGVPFSDPMADGPVIQASSAQALRNGISLKTIFAQLEDIRKEAHIPLIMMGYLNSFMQYGFERFCKDCQRVGVDGMIIPDLPFQDYLETYKPIADDYSLKIIMLITPETSEERIRLIDSHTSGFIYMVSSASTTGAQSSFDEKKQAYFQRIDAMKLRNPRLVGFGISNKATWDAACQNASGGIIGSRFVQLLSEKESVAEAVDTLLEDIGRA